MQLTYTYLFSLCPKRVAFASVCTWWCREPVAHPSPRISRHWTYLPYPPWFGEARTARRDIGDVLVLFYGADLVDTVFFIPTIRGKLTLVCRPR